MSTNPKSTFVKDLAKGDDLNDLFYVKYIAVMEARDGRQYLNMVLADSSGDVEARKWSGANYIADKVSRGDYVRATGKVNLYQGRLQVILNEVHRLEAESVNLDDFISKSENEPSKMFDELVALVDSLSEVYIRDLLRNVLFDAEISHRLLTWQAGKTIHHAYQSGLLEHILSCANLGRILSAHYKVNESYVIAGCILHDLCKVHELTEGPMVEYSDEGKLVGHLVKGVELVEHYSSKVRGFPHSVKMHLKHILLAHHGEYEYGSPKLPQTSEAYLVHLIDLMDSKMNSMEMVKKSDNNQGPWSGFVKHLDRIVYKEELPSFKEYQSDEKPTQPIESKSKPRAGSGELKQNLGSLLKDFKPND